MRKKILDINQAKADATHDHAASAITSGTMDGDRLPALSTSKKGGVPATGTPSGKFLRDDGTWQSAGSSLDSTKRSWFGI
jgi:hypothetical protein